MRIKEVLIVLAMFVASLTYGQIKIGDNPQNINASSVLELESTSRAFVITRVNSTQMNAITPLEGAMVYNTDSQCIHYYDGTQWLNLCDALTNISLIDNGDGTYTFSDANNVETDINTLNESLTINNGDLILTETGGNEVRVALDSLNTQTFTTDPVINPFSTMVITEDASGTNFNFEVGIIDGENIQDGSIRQVDLAGASVGSVQLRDNSVRAIAIATDAVTSLKILNGTILPEDIASAGNNQVLVTGAGGTVAWVDRSTFSAISDQVTITGVGTSADPFKVEDLSIVTSKLGNNAVTTTKILDETILSQDIFDGTIIEADLADNAVTTGKILNSTILAEDIANDAIDNSKIADNAVQVENILNGTANQVLKTNAAGTLVEWGTLISSDNGNVVTTGSDGGAFYNDATLQSNIATNSANISANDTDIANNVTAIALKEDTANKSDDDTFATANNVNFPTQLAVKTYVDNQVATVNPDDDITAVTFDGTDLTVEEGATSFSADLSALEESADIAAVQADVDANETAANNAIATLQADVDQNEADADAAIALKENSANKSDDDTFATADNVNFPTQLAVKTYVDNQVATVNPDDDITAVTFDGTDLTVEEGATSFSADLSALEESADIAAVQADVDANETAANNAIATLQADVDQNEADADAAIALKENSANKSDDDTFATADNVNFPTQLAVKTYVDNQVATVNPDDDITAVTFDGTDLTVEEGATSFSADLSALEESADIAAVQADVDANETAANNAIATLQADVDQNEADADAAIALKENSANKSDDDTFATADNVNFPTQLAVKTYVDNQVATVNPDDDITAVTFDGTDLTVEEGTTSFSADLSALEESADIAAVQADVDANETAANNAIATLQADVDQNEADADAAIALKENSANKSDDDTFATADNVNFPTQLAVKTYVDNQVATVNPDDDITAVTFDGTDLTVEEGTTSFSADLSALEESADIAAVQADVDANETAANNAIATLQANVDQNEADADAAIALKENSANKSDDDTFATADNVNFPTQLAVKTYVDNQVATEPWRNQDNTPATNSSGAINYPNGNVGIGINAPTSTLHSRGSFATAISQINANTILDETYHTIIIGGDLELDLPIPNTCVGRLYIVKNPASMPPTPDFNVTLATLDEYLDSFGNVKTTFDGGVTKLQSDGNNWQQIN